MKTRFLQRMLVISFLLVGLGGSSAQRQSDSSSTSQAAEKNSGTRAHSRTSNSAVADAIKSDRFELTRGEYRLEHPINVEGSVNKRDNIKIDYQIGTIDDKPASVCLVIDKKKAPKDSKEADAMFGVVPNEPVRISGPEQMSLVQKCKNGKTCVKTDENGRCIKWVCS